MRKPSIRFLAKVIGATVAAFRAVRYATLCYRALENDKSELYNCKGDFDSH